ncbi:DUF397 domain-containing protein [Streptosporangium sp. NBC_01755]|uniref:DUF397 domain-containing protein n=1 Tax=Streptosporangium sp. NBC_01755 TaxID=2975949 RepID=UPI002DD90B5A|nr:DUF397 domain-containing protein [Streptosporangium sp. NBC_01755]WSD02783.1 DUF397 domain-containing protein [Streptosporangium sp. NBC_01755]
MDDLIQELHSAHWRKSTLSGGDGSNCVEIANLSTNHRAIRDSKNPTAPALILTPYQWTTFITTIKNGDCD